MTMDNRSRWLALYVLCLGDLMIVLDGTIVNVALPSIRDDLGFTQSELAWVVNAYLLTFGGFLLLGGRLGDLFGHRRLFLGGIALFTAASLACGLAGSQEMLVAARAVQGAGGAVVAAVALSLLMTLFTEQADRAKAMGVFGFVLSGGGVIGVLAGGILTDALSWHWIFLVNIPVGVLVYVLSLRLLPTQRGPAASRPRRRRGRRDDHAGAHGGGLRDRERQRGGLGVAADARPARDRGGAARRVPHRRVARRLAARAARHLPQPQRLVGERARHLPRRRDVRVLLLLGAVHAAGARVHADGGRARLPAGDDRVGCLLASALGPPRHAVRDQASAARRPRVHARRPRPLGAHARRRQLGDRHPPGDAAHRARAPASPSTRSCSRR